MFLRRYPDCGPTTWDNRSFFLSWFCTMKSLWHDIRSVWFLIPKTGHTIATRQFFWKLWWKILYKYLDLKGGGTRAGEGGLPLYPPPPLRSRCLYRIFHQHFPKNRPVAFQWPVKHGGTKGSHGQLVSSYSVASRIKPATKVKNYNSQQKYNKKSNKKIQY